MRFAIVIEKARENYSAYVPDLPGCVANGDSLESTRFPGGRRKWWESRQPERETECIAAFLALR